MPQRISWSVAAKVEDGPSLDYSQSALVDAFDVVNVLIPGGTADVIIDVQPSGTGAVRFFAIGADRYGKDLAFTVMDGGVADVELDGPIILAGACIEALLKVAPKRIKVSNAGLDDVTVEIVVGRDLPDV